jgi:AAA domain-containing protein
MSDSNLTLPTLHNPITLHNLEAEKPGDNFAMLLVGKNEAGKSRLAATAPPPVLFLDFDRKAQALAGKKGVYALTFADPAQTTIQPTAFNAMLDVLGKLERGERSLKALGFNVGDEVKVQTLVFDSIYTIAKAARNYALYVNPKELARIVSIAGHQYRVPRSWDGWGVESEMVESSIMQARSIKGLNVIAILHEVAEQAENSTEDNPIYTGKIELYPRRYNPLMTYFNEIWRITRDFGTIPKLTLQPDGVFTKAGTTLVIPTDKIVPNIQEIIRIARGNGQPASLEKPTLPLPIAPTKAGA